MLPLSPGSSSFREMPYPLLYISYKDRISFSSIDGFSAEFPLLPRLQVGLGCFFNPGRSDDKDPRYRGWGGIGPALEPSLFVSYGGGPVQLTLEVKHDVGASDGTYVDSKIDFRFPIAGKMFFDLAPQLVWQDDKAARSFFGVTEGQSATAAAEGFTIPSYEAYAGLCSLGVNMLGTVRLSDEWVIVTVLRLKEFMGSAATSPLVEDDLQLDCGLFAAYHFRI